MWLQELHESEETTKFGDESKKCFKELPKPFILPPLKRLKAHGSIIRSTVQLEIPQY